jgi:TRAF3-interacting protein 1
MTDLERIVNDANAKISSVIVRPRMTEKLLSKPPFRFLHDTITAIINETGFAKGLFSEEELDSGFMVEKFAKMAFLDKIIQLVGICKVKNQDII